MSANFTGSKVPAELRTTLYCFQWEPTMSFSAKDAGPPTPARARLSEVAGQVKTGSEKIITRTGESCAALLEAARFDDSRHQLEPERIHLRMLEDVRRGLEDIQAGRAFEADAALADLQRRRAEGRLVTTRG